jgi:hypothetical protein
MALVLGFDRLANGALVTSSAAPASTARRRFGWAISSAGAAHRANATAGLPAGAVTVKGRAYSSGGAVCFTTTKPEGTAAKFIGGVRHHVNGSIFVKTTAPATPARSGHEKLLIDRVDGAVIFDSVA